MSLTSNAQLDLSAILNIFTDPVLWSEKFLRNPMDKERSLKLRSYQSDYLRVSPTFKGCVLQQGRRSGKSVTLEIDCLWHAYAYPLVRQFQEKSQKQKPYRILVVAPFEDQIKEIWKGFGSLIGDSPLLKNSVVKFKSSQEFLIEFDNGSTIEGSCAGLNSSSRGTKLRGKTADFIYADELDYIPRELMEQVVIPIFTSSVNCKMRVASTPSGEQGLFWEYCKRHKELGWYHQHIPSWHPANDNWMSIEQAKTRGIPIADSTEFQVRSITTDDAYNREYGAEFADPSTGVYKNLYIQKYIAKYKRNINLEDPDIFNPQFKVNPEHIYTMGVDWNTYKNGGQIVVVEFCRTPTFETYFDEIKQQEISVDFTNKYRIFYRVGVKVKDATQAATRAEIIRILREIPVNHIYVDYGYGDTNIEELTNYSRQFPELRISEKLKAMSAGEYVEHWDPVLREKVKKTNKNMMINNSVLALEEGMIVLPAEEDMKTRLIGQMRGYRVKNVTAKGDFTYEGEDHILDAFNLAMYAFAREYGALLRNSMKMRPVYSSSTITAAYENVNRNSNFINNTTFKAETNYRDPDAPKGLFNPVISIPRIGSRSMGFGNRRSF